MVNHNPGIHAEIGIMCKVGKNTTEIFKWFLSMKTSLSDVGALQLKSVSDEYFR